jgi:hypothetical protein
MLLLIILFILLFGGGGFYGYHSGYYGPRGMGLASILFGRPPQNWRKRSQIHSTFC